MQSTSNLLREGLVLLGELADRSIVTKSKVVGTSTLMATCLAIMNSPGFTQEPEISSIPSHGMQRALFYLLLLAII